MSGFIRQLVHTGIYKRNQGRIARQITFATMAIVVALGLWRLSLELKVAKWAGNLNLSGFHYWLPGVLLLAGLWIAYRAVNFPGFADFLIAVEAEMNKVSWPTRTELFRASIVVLVTIFVLAAILYGFDYFWIFVFKRVLRIF